MAFFRYLFLPVLSAIAGLGIAAALHYAGGIDRLASGAAGVAVFCAMLALASHWRMERQVSRMGRQLGAISGFETDLLSRLETMEKRHVSPLDLAQAGRRLDGIERQITSLENRLDAQVPGESSRPAANGTGLSGASQNVVELKPAVARSKPRVTQAELSRREPVIRLQPVVELPGQTPVAVEAIAYFGSGEKAEPALPLVGEAGSEAAGELDRQIVARIARIIRKMEALGQLLPIHYRLAAPNASLKPLGAIADMLRSDKKLAANLVLSVPVSEMPRPGSEADRLLGDLAQRGLRLCAEGTTGIEDAGAAIRSGRYAFCRMAVGDLLHYAVREGERTGDAIAPLAASGKVALIATGVSEGHQAANLIDMDITLTQGDLISPPRDIVIDDDGNAAKMPGVTEEDGHVLPPESGGKAG